MIYVIRGIDQDKDDGEIVEILFNPDKDYLKLEHGQGYTAVNLNNEQRLFIKALSITPAK
ncbi:hypothetical protein [Bacillus cereus]|uniref:hypothetical protein n=1 Tax=Bacillus cereus TaxID=1396 RepID=UPI002405A2BD|nr:hypothetical protein [Bacillus cereus]MDF9638817.1 hypothetical protein [Bacillus cereus]